jgi:hypothetical protein
MLASSATKPHLKKTHTHTHTKHKKQKQTKTNKNKKQNKTKNSMLQNVKNGLQLRWIFGTHLPFCSNVKTGILPFGNNTVGVRFFTARVLIKILETKGGGRKVGSNCGKLEKSEFKVCKSVHHHIFK